MGTLVFDDAPAEAPRSYWDMVKAGAQTADDAVRAAANAATFGMADRVAGYLGGEGTDAEVKKTEEARTRSPIATTAGDVAGSLAIPGIGGGAAAARLGGGVGARALGYGLEGAAIGAAQGAGNTYTGNAEDYGKNALMGGVLGGALGSTVGAAFGPRPMVSGAATPTVRELQGATDVAYRNLRLNPTQYDPGALVTHADQLAQQLRLTGRVPDYRPSTWGAIEQMRTLQDVTPASLDVIRQGLNRIPRTEQAAADREAARIVKNSIDNFIENAPNVQGAVLPGSTQAAADAAGIARVARESRAGQGRAEMMANIRQYAEDLAASQHSGRNVDNIIRQQVRSRLLNPLSEASKARLAGFNAEERQALGDVVRAGPVANTLRAFGNMGGGGGGAMTTLLGLGAGGAYGYANEDKAKGALLGLSLAGGGLGLRSMANRLGRDRIAAAEQMVRQRNPLYQARAANAPQVRGGGLSAGATQGARDAITLELLRNRMEQ